MPLIVPQRKRTTVKLVEIVEAVGPALLQVKSVMTREEYDNHIE